ncbi:Protein of unknown function [Pyronema omphalodes CBS 100304]|uniref:Uncharacterized protein n=1 Tax=Pyronema omphalodes (strain CBS 100304) TaxID=1076935 RepID=U4LC99_PYROM|nr:Protein of unknown function [Pyronema omphalodes CBS 100304]
MPQYFAPRISAIFINLILDIGIAVSVLALFFTLIQQMRARTDVLLGNLRVEEIGMVNV